MKDKEPEPHDSHVLKAVSVFRNAGMTIAAMQYPRTAEALDGLRRFNGVPDGHPSPPAWNYFPNAYMRDHWREYY